ncbi:BlaI/MecI/CopY family transcriptional regulator [Clostridium paraputrificum]|uniref:BlaI/MecI/CopY family transcriptional regulator n=1 Tax=Clostridium TaxID=1485 RepID=UPI003D34AEA4
MNKIPDISDTELLVMKVLWNESPLTSTKIISNLKTNKPWSPKTIHTLISRLLKKGALSVNKNTTPYEYTPLVTEKEVQVYETRSFLHRIYDGSLKMLLNNFIEDENLSNDDISELKKILEENLNGGE